MQTRQRQRAHVAAPGLSTCCGTGTGIAVRAFSSSACCSALATLIGGRTYVEETRWLRSRPAGSLEARLSARPCPWLPGASVSLGQLAGWTALAGHIGLAFHIVAGRWSFPRERARPAERKPEWKQARWQPPAVRAECAESWPEAQPAAQLTGGRPRAGTRARLASSAGAQTWGMIMSVSMKKMAARPFQRTVTLTSPHQRKRQVGLQRARETHSPAHIRTHARTR